MSSSTITVCKRSSLIAIVNRLYMNANNDIISDEAKKNDIICNGNDGMAMDSETEILSRESSPKNEKLKTKPPPTVIPLSSELATNGFQAIGGCRQCSRTFNDRLSLIHHFVDHFPTIFYSFESSLQATMPPAIASSALGISKNSQTSPKNFVVRQHNNNNYALGSTSTGPSTMTFFPYSPSSATSSGNHQKQQQQSVQRGKKCDSNGETKMPKKKVNKSKNNETATTVTSTANSRFTDFNKSSNDLPYDMCPHCCQTFSDHSVYSDHVKTHETPVISLGSPMTSEIPLKCEYCDLRFSNEYLLKEHKKIHCRICSICSKTLMTAFDLNLHMGIHSGFSYDCKDCGRCFSDRKTLALHNKMHRSDLSIPDSDDDKHTTKASTNLSKENVKKFSKIDKSAVANIAASFAVEDKPESFFKNNPYFENIFKQNPRKRRQRLHHRSGTNGEDAEKLEAIVTDVPLKKKSKTA